MAFLVETFHRLYFQLIIPVIIQHRQQMIFHIEKSNFILNEILKSKFPVIKDLSLIDLWISALCVFEKRKW